MSEATLQDIARWLACLENVESIDITFHGGEPLLAGDRFFRTALPLLKACLAPRRARFLVQSNLWLLTDELCQIFREHNVSIGTSLDGPERISDSQRGEGYFRSTMAGIQRARSHDLNVGCVCTFTAQSAPRAKEIFDFFVSHGLSFTLQPALRSLRSSQGNGFALSPDAYATLVIDMLELSLAHPDRPHIATLDALCQSISAGHGGICTFIDCLGYYLAIGPEGDIYPCQRFVGMPEYWLGNVNRCLSMGALHSTLVWRGFEERQNRVTEECASCPNISFCRGGCPYDNLAENKGTFGDTLRDPHCRAYQRIFDYIADRALQEVFSKENIDSIIHHVDPEAGLLHRGDLLSIMSAKLSMRRPKWDCSEAHPTSTN